MQLNRLQPNPNNRLRPTEQDLSPRGQYIALYEHGADINTLYHHLSYYRNEILLRAQYEDYDDKYIQLLGGLLAHRPGETFEMDRVMLGIMDVLYSFAKRHEPRK